MCFSLLRNRRTVQTVKLTLHNRPKPKSVIYRRPFVETNQTARISLQILAMSKSNPEDKQPDQCALTYRRARPDIPLNYPPSSPSEPQSVVPSVVPASASAAPVKGLLGPTPDTRKQKIHERGKKLLFFNLCIKSGIWSNFHDLQTGRCARNLPVTPTCSGRSKRLR